MILVTGGTGLVGSHLLYYLSQRNIGIRAIYRTEKKRDQVLKIFNYYSKDAETLFNRIEWHECTVSHIPKLEELMVGIDTVYHCAALVSFDPADEKNLRKVNIKGTANLVNISIANKVQKFCYVSSIAALGESLDGKSIDEESPWNPEKDHSHYAITKYGGELEVWRGSQEGLNVIIVNPGVIIGPGFWKSSSSSIFTRVYRGISRYTEGSTAYIDVHDLIKIMIELMESDIRNQNYVSISENRDFKSFLDIVAKELGVKPPNKKASRSLLLLASTLDWFRAKMMGKRRRLPKALVNSLLKKTVYDNTKLVKELNFNFKSTEESVKETARYFIEDHR